MQQEQITLIFNSFGYTGDLEKRSWSGVGTECTVLAEYTPTPPLKLYIQLARSLRRVSSLLVLTCCGNMFSWPLLLTGRCGTQ